MCVQALVEYKWTMVLVANKVKPFWILMHAQKQGYGEQVQTICLNSLLTKWSWNYHSKVSGIMNQIAGPICPKCVISPWAKCTDPTWTNNPIKPAHHPYVHSLQIRSCGSLSDKLQNLHACAKHPSNNYTTWTKSPNAPPQACTPMYPVTTWCLLMCLCPLLYSCRPWRCRWLCPRSTPSEPIGTRPLNLLGHSERCSSIRSLSA